MAITASDLAIELRLSVDGEDLDDAQTTVLERLVSVANSIVGRYASSAPDDVKDEAAIRIGAYLYDVPAGKGMATSALANSGAQSLLAMWRVQRGWSIGGDAPKDLSDEVDE